MNLETQILIFLPFKPILFQTPRRRRENRESSDDSSKSNARRSNTDKQLDKPLLDAKRRQENVPSASKDKPAEKSVPNKQEAKSHGNDENSQFKNPTAPDENKKRRAGNLSKKPLSSSDDSDGTVSKGKQNTQRKQGKIKASITRLVVGESTDEESKVRKRSSQSNDAPNTAISATKNNTERGKGHHRIIVYT